MDRIVFLVGPYYPNFSAVGYCLYQVVKCIRDVYDVEIISFRDDKTHLAQDDIEGVKIRRIETKYMKMRNRPIFARGMLSFLALKLVRVWGALRRLCSRETVDRALVKAYLDELCRLTPRPNVIIPLVFPFESVLAALEVKERTSDVVEQPYIFDDFVESGSLHVLNFARDLKRRRHLDLERKMLSSSDAIFSMHPLRSHFFDSFEKSLFDKIIFLEHPLLISPVTKIKHVENSALRLVYTGSLIRNVREPDYLIRLLKSLKVSSPVKVDFYVMGNAADSIKTEQVGHLYINNFGRVSKFEADAAVQSADILLNMGEAKGKQVSSKIFEYMSTGKPIIHFAFVEHDAVAQIISAYPRAICIYQSRFDFASDLERIESFISEMRGLAPVPFDEIRAIYPDALPETTANTIRYIAESKLLALRS